MRVLFVIPHPQEGASGRHRVLQYLPWLDRAGIRYAVRPFMSRALYHILYHPGRLGQKVTLTALALANRFLDVVRAARADVVVIHREAVPLGTAVLERLMARLGPAVVFDFDDAVYLNPVGPVHAWTRVFRNRTKTAAIIAASRAVIAGNATLEAYARRFNPRVSVIPTPVDTEHYAQRDAATNGRPVVIGWIGSPTTAAYLALIQPALAQIQRRYPQVAVRIVGAGNPPLRLDNLSAAGWQLDREVQELHRFDIGLMPMPDSEWTRGKCGFKALLYMSVGMPVVASPVGVASDIVRDGVNGFLASSTDAWIARLGRLIEDPDLRARMGQAGRAIAQREYSLATHAPRFVQVLQRAAEERRA
jgi:glycosyltransferase involved in cell wall biosynthesis